MSNHDNKKTLDLYPIDYPFETLVSRINAAQPKLILDPDFQRKYKWDRNGWGRASKFIESCLMRIPLPSCYFAEDEDLRHIVIDGVQRLTTIKRFFGDEFALEELSTFKELEGKKFSELGDFRAELEATTIRCIVLRKENPKKLVREIFARLNQGAVALSSQEIRHAIYPGSLDKLLNELSQNQLILNFGITETSDRTKDSREGDEQVLRFFAFADDLAFEKYEDVLSTYLDNFMEKNSNIEEDQVKILRRRFITALDNCHTVFQDDIFSDFTREKRKQGLVYYDLVMPTVGLLDPSIVNQKVQQIRGAYQTLCSSAAFRKTLSGGLQKKSSIVKRRKLWVELLEKALD